MYSGVSHATSETNTLEIATYTMYWSNNTMLELGKHQTRFAHRIHRVRKLALSLNFMHLDGEASSEGWVSILSPASCFDDIASLKSGGNSDDYDRRCIIPSSLATSPQKLAVTTWRLFLELDWYSHTRPMAKRIPNAVSDHRANCEIHPRTLPDFPPPCWWF